VNVLPMLFEISMVSNPMISEASLPNFFVLTEFCSESVRVAAFEQLQRTFKGHVFCRGEQHVNMVRH
jgi:hypothetical protein